MSIPAKSLWIFFYAASFALAAPDYEREIRPLLVEKCSSCHGALRQEAGLRLDAGRLIHQGSENGAIIDLKDAGGSKLIARVVSEDVDVRMPPEGEGTALTKAQVALLREWIAAGGRYPDTEKIPAGPDQHWAYQIPQRPKLPTGSSAANPVDAFVHERLSAHGLRPARPAQSRLQVRRLYLDLIGLPPTPEELAAFEANPDPQRWSQLVDRLLAHPAYGERWGRHWMDVWRYSDWDGYKQAVRGSQRHVWRWRDWIVESLNRDKGYDQMVREMLAGDELAPEDESVLAATGYLARSFHNSNRNIWLDATVEHAAKAFLAMTISCARCHDHKYDPIAQREYYAFRAIFEPHHVRTERLPGSADLLQQGLARVYDSKLDEPTYFYIGGNEKHPDKENPVSPGVPQIIKVGFKPQPVSLPPRAKFPSLRPFVEKEEIATAEKKLAAALTRQKAGKGDRVLIDLQVTAAKATLVALRARWEADREKYLAKAGETKPEKSWTAAATEGEAKEAGMQVELHQKRIALKKAKALADSDKSKPKKVADANKALEASEKAFAKLKQESAKTKNKYTSVGKSYPATSTGRRSALARWVTSNRNPLTARVAVNHIWLRHFGDPLVSSVADFGLRAPSPEHQRLLDWLAVELMENGWRMKHIHRLIVCSDTYRRTSTVQTPEDQECQSKDPENRLFWRANVRRLEAEVVRDSILQVANRLDRRMGGPDIDFALGEQVHRRSLYFRHAYEKQMKMLVLFDAAGPTECYRRSESIVPQQALALANSSLVIEQSRRLAAELRRTNAAPEQFIQQAFSRILGRPPLDQEQQACLQFLARQANRLSDPAKLTLFGGRVKPQVAPATSPEQRAQENLVHVLLNHNDFVTVR